MNRNLGLVAVAVVLIVTLLAVWAVWRGSRLTPVSPTGSATPGEVGTISIYTNGVYGFSMMYPAGARVSEVFESTYHLPSSWRANALPTASGTPVVAIIAYDTRSENSYPRYYTAQVRIGASADPDEVERCLAVGSTEGETELSEVTLGGVPFRAFSFKSAGMMQYLKGVSYRAIHEGSCIAIEKVAAGSNYQDDPASDHDITDELLDAEYEKLSGIVESFSFARP